MGGVPVAVILAGCNGSGKTTASATLLPEGVSFINADLIAQRESGIPSTAADIRAGRMLVEEISALVADGQDFAFETTLATRSLKDRVLEWRAAGYRIHLLFFTLADEDLAVERVKGRVAEGGHDVPEETIRRRYRAGRKYLIDTYLPLADTWRLYDNSSQEGPHLIARQNEMGEVRVADPALWEELNP